MQIDDGPHSPGRRIRLSGVAGSSLALLLVPWIAQAAAGLMFLRESPLSRFTEDDFAMLRHAAGIVLNSESSDAGQDWSNPATGNSGRITATSRFVAADGRPCARLKMDARSPEFDGSWTYTVCRSADDGDWRIDPAAKAP